MKKIVLMGIILLSLTGCFKRTVAKSNSIACVDYPACAGCHGANFEKRALGKSKVVKNMSKVNIITALKGYQDGSYGGTMKGLMKGQVRRLKDKDIENIASCISSI